jgi:multidrug resistance efflux pump
MFVSDLLRRKPLRIGLAVTLIATAVWATYPYLINRVAASAYLNAELIRITAPIAGRLADTIPRKGAVLHQQASVRLIEPFSLDRRRLLDLERRMAAAKQSGDLAQQQLHEIEHLDFEMKVRAESYRVGVVDKLTQEIEEAAKEEAGCVAEARQRREVSSRFDKLARSGLISEVRSAEVQASEQATSTRCDVARARKQRIDVELKSARNGTFLRDGSNDVPYSQQQRDRLVLRRQELETLLSQETARYAQLNAEIGAEMARMEEVSNYKADLPQGYVVWSTAASPGSAVTEGQTLMDLADCQHQFLVVELPERDFEKIKPGDVAMVRLVGSNNWQPGLVQKVRGSAARSDDRLFAAQVPSVNSGFITVEVSLSSSDMAVDNANFCDIGRLAEVRFDRGLFSKFGASMRASLGLKPAQVARN